MITRSEQLAPAAGVAARPAVELASHDRSGAELRITLTRAGALPS